MFPSSFNARVAERMAIWGGLLGFLAFLYVSTEVIQAWKLSKFSDDAHRASAALSAHANAAAALARVAGLRLSAAPDRDRLARDLDLVNASLAAMTQTMPTPEVRSLAAEIREPARRAQGRGCGRARRARARSPRDGRHAELGKAIANAIEGINAAQTSFLASHRQNKILITVLTIFILGLRFWSSNIAGWSGRSCAWPPCCVRASTRSRDLAAYALRRDEIGAFAQALTSHFQLVRHQQEMASDEQAKLSERLRAAGGTQARKHGVSGSHRRDRAASRGSCRAHVGGVGQPGFDLVRSGRPRGRVGAIDAARVEPRRSRRRLDPGYRGCARDRGRRRREHVGGRGRGAKPGGRGARRRQGA